MSVALALRLRQPLPAAVDVSRLTPGMLRSMTRAQIEHVPLRMLNRSVALAELFDLSGDDASHLVFTGVDHKLLRIGARMTGGRITVEGHAGDGLGFEMREGLIEVRGDCGDFAGCEMSGGQILVDGHAGDFLGASQPGNRQGMRGGLVHVRGNVGARAADRMRRGLVLIEGDTGDYLGARMLAGTVIVGGRTGASPGLGLKRGTLFLLRAPLSMPAFFNECGLHALPFIPLLERALPPWATGLPFTPLPRRTQRWCGDLGSGGTGEILLRAT